MFITIIFSAVKRMYWHSCCCKQWLQNFQSKIELQLRILTDWLTDFTLMLMDGLTDWLIVLYVTFLSFLNANLFIYLLKLLSRPFLRIKYCERFFPNHHQRRQLWKWFQLHSHTCADRNWMIFSLAHSQA